MARIADRILAKHEFIKAMDALVELVPKAGLTWIEIRYQGDAPMQQGSRTWGKYNEKVAECLRDYKSHTQNCSEEKP